MQVRKSPMITLAVDCMGGDHGPRVTLAACRQFLDKHPKARLLLVGKPESLESFQHERVTLVPASVQLLHRDDIGFTALLEDNATSPIILSRRAGDVSPGLKHCLQMIDELLPRALESTQDT